MKVLAIYDAWSSFMYVCQYMHLFALDKPLMGKSAFMLLSCMLGYLVRLGIHVSLTELLEVAIAIVLDGRSGSLLAMREV